MKIVSKSFYIFLTSTPLLSLALFYSFVLRAYIALGRWPIPYRPDPKDLNFDLHMLSVDIGLTVPFAVIIPWVIVTILSKRKQSFSRNFLIYSTIVYCTSFFAWFLLLRVDPGSFVMWFFD